MYLDGKVPWSRANCWKTRNSEYWGRIRWKEVAGEPGDWEEARSPGGSLRDCRLESAVAVEGHGDNVAPALLDEARAEREACPLCHPHRSL